MTAAAAKNLAGRFVVDVAHDDDDDGSRDDGDGSDDGAHGDDGGDDDGV